MNNNFIKNFLLTGTGNFLVILFGLLNSILITRWLGPENKGIYTVIMNIVMFFNLLLGEGLRRSNTIIIAQNKNYLKKLLSNNLLYLIGIIAFNAIIFVIFRNFSFTIVQNIAPSLFFIGLLISTFSIMWQSVQAIYLGMKEISYFNMIMVCASFLILVFNYIGISIFDFTLNKILYNMFFAYIIIFVVSYIALYRYGKVGSGESTFKFGKQFILTLKSTLTHLEVFVFKRSGIFFINSLISTSAVGIFSISILFSEMLQRFPNVAGTLIFSNVANKDISINQQTAKVVRSIIFLLFLSVIFLIIFGKVIIILFYGGSFADAYLPLISMSCGLIFVGAGSILHSYYMGKSFPKKMIILNSVISIISLILNYIFIKMYSIIGAGISYSIILSLWGISYLIMFVKETGTPLIDLLVVKKEDILGMIGFLRRKIS